MLEYPGARHGGGLEDRGRGLPRVHRRRRQGQRLLRRPPSRRSRSSTACAAHPVTGSRVDDGLHRPASRVGQFRIEHDSLGEVQVPADAMWGPQTQRAVENFPISGSRIERRAHPGARPDQGARPRASTRRSGVLATPTSPTRSPQAADEVADGRRGRRSSRSTCSRPARGTSSNMNANEVIAHAAPRARSAGSAGAPERPRQRVAVVATTCSRPPIHLAAAEAIERDLLPALERAGTGARRSKARGVRRRGEVRAHPPDGRDAGHAWARSSAGYAAQVAARPSRGSRRRVPALRELPLGGTAVGTGHQRAAGFAPAVIAELASATRPAAHRGARTTSRRRARATRWSRRRAAARRSPWPRQDRQRPPVDGQRAARRPGRDPPARPAAGLVDHAGQGEPGDARGRHPGVRPGDRQRRRGRRSRGAAGQLRAQRDACR